MTDTVAKFRITERFLKNNIFHTCIESPKQDQELKSARMAKIVNIECTNCANVLFSDASHRLHQGARYFQNVLRFHGTCLLFYLLTYLITYLLIYLLNYSLTNLLNHLRIYLLNYLFT